MWAAPSTSGGTSEAATSGAILDLSRECRWPRPSCQDGVPSATHHRLAPSAETKSYLTAGEHISSRSKIRPHQDKARVSVWTVSRLVIPGAVCFRLKPARKEPISNSIFPEAALRRSDNSDGFTLIELMVVLMTIALLIAIAIPTFLGFRGGAQDTAAHASLRAAAKIGYLVVLEEGSLPGRPALLALLPSVDPSIDWIDHKDSSTGPRQVSIAKQGQQLVLAALSETGSCYWLRVMSGSTVASGFVEAAATCEAFDYRLTADTGW